MDVLPILGAFVGGIGGGIFASRMVRMQLDKFQKELQDFAARLSKIQEEVKQLQEEEAAWKVKWGAPLQESINALSKKLEALPTKRKN